MKNLGIIVNDLGINDRNLNMILGLNYFARNEPINPIVFYKEIKPYPTLPFFTILFQNEVCSFDGILIVTDIYSANLALQNRRNCKKFYYIWDLDWMNLAEPVYNNSAAVFMNDNFDFLVRSVDHQLVMKHVWNRESTIVGDWDVKQLRTVIERL